MTDTYEIEFRDGKRAVAPHVYELLAGHDVHNLTYEEAIQFVNGNLFGQHVDKKFGAFIQRHFKEHG